MQSFTFGSDEGFDAVHEAMLQYITGRQPGNSFVPRTAFHTSFNLNDATMLLNVLEIAMMASHTDGDAREWAEQYYRDLAGTIGVELV